MINQLHNFELYSTFLIPTGKPVLQDSKRELRRHPSHVLKLGEDADRKKLAEVT